VYVGAFQLIPDLGESKNFQDFPERSRSIMLRRSQNKPCGNYQSSAYLVRIFFYASIDRRRKDVSTFDYRNTSCEQAMLPAVDVLMI